MKPLHSPPKTVLGLRCTISFLTLTQGYYYTIPFMTDDGQEMQVEYFRSVGRSMFTLYMVMTLEKWPEVVDPLVVENGWGYSEYFCGYSTVLLR